MDEKSYMKLFMEPESVALIGVSRGTGDGSFNILENMMNYGYSGKIYPVNPKTTEILGKQVYKNVKDIEGDVDLAVISTPRDAVLDAVRDCADADIKAIIVVTQGFADGDARGRRLQENLVEIARENELRILGPNTMGVLNAAKNFSTSFIPFKMSKSPIGLISQSGLFFPGFPGLGFGKGVDVGNACDVDCEDVLEYFGEDPDIKLIFVHIEGVENGKRFLEISKRVTAKKPVIALKSGRSERGVKAVASHTGSLAGKDEIYDAAFRQAGIIRVYDVDELQEISKALLNFPSMVGKKIAGIVYPGAAGVMLSDACEEFGLEIAELSEETVKHIKPLFPDWMRIENPVDIWIAGMNHGVKKVFEVVLDAVLSDKNVDAVICVVFPPDTQGYSEEIFDLSDVIEKESSRNKPIAIWMFGKEQERFSGKLEGQKNVAAFSSLRNAAKALSVLSRSRKYNSGVGHKGAPIKSEDRV